MNTEAGSDMLHYLWDPRLNPLFWVPERLGASSAWWGHVPFAHWIVNSAQPRLLVELGTEAGVSYAAFCQAVVHGHLDARCFAVDTWEGDPHTGRYGEHVYQEFRQFHDAHYGAFSTLLRCTFDAALEHVADGSIDLLHIDGLHTYEAVQHDFESWRQKLSNRAVVLFHDTNMRERGFGVWRLWMELRDKFPDFEFLHGHGLGVLAVGHHAPPAVAALCALDNPTAASVRERFAQLGERWILDSRERALAHELAARDTRIAELEEEAMRARDEAMRQSEAEARLRSEAVRQSEAEARLRSEAVRAREEARRVAAAAQARCQAVEAEWRASAAEAERLRADLAHATTEREVVLASTTWRVTWPLRATADVLKGGAKMAWRTLTRQPSRKLHEQPRQLNYVAEGHGVRPVGLSAANGTADDALGLPAPEPAPMLEKILCQRFGALEPLRSYLMPGGSRRLTIVTDSINAGSLYGGVGTAIILAALLAQRLGAHLRLVTRTESAEADNFGLVLATNGIQWRGNIEFVHSPAGQGREVPVNKDDLFLTTSWWTTWSTRRAVDPGHIVYLLQEDERMFYPHGDDRLRCSETLADSDIHFVVNSELLFEHLTTGRDALANVERNGVWFEPAFPASHYYPDPSRQAGDKRNFFFYARPHNLRNLYWRGLEAIGAALEEGILQPHEWNLHFVGRDLSDIVLPRGARPRILQNLPWPDYAALVRQVDVGLSLMDSPHASYPPLDLAASGAVVITNRHGVKTSLARYSDNILCVEPTIDGLKHGIANATMLAADGPTRAANYGRNRMLRDWTAAFEPVLRRFAPMAVEG